MRQTFYIACDVGGTNCNTGLLEHKEKDNFTLLENVLYKSEDFSSVIELLERSFEHLIKNQSLSTIPPICISGSGPTDGETCCPGNLPTYFAIRRTEIEKHFNTPVFLINDLRAISYAIPLIDEEDSIIHIPHTPTLPKKHDHLPIHYTIVGVGTGLGMSQFHAQRNDKNQFFCTQPGESGRCSFAPTADGISWEVYRFLSKEGSIPLYWEDVVSSSKGLPSLYRFLTSKYTADEDFMRSCHEIEDSQHQYTALNEILSLHAEKGNLAAIATVQLWTYLLARCCSEMGLATLPNAIFLAGGVPKKNKGLFLNTFVPSRYIPAAHSFAKTFQEGYKKALFDSELRKIALYILCDYNASLYGAAFYAHVHSTIKRL